MDHRLVCVIGVALAALGACAADPSGATSTSTAVAPSTASQPTMATTTASESPATTSTPDGAVGQWAEDMQALADGVRRIHPDPFWRQSEADFDASLAAAPALLATLDGTDATAEVMRMTSRIDGHSGVYLADAGFHLYDIRLYEFDGEFAVIAAADPTLLGTTVVSIDGMLVADAAAAVAPYSPFDNAATVRLVVPTLLTTPEVLRAAGVIDDTDAPRYVVRGIDGTVRTIDPGQRSWVEAVARDPRPIGMTKIASVPSLARIDEPFWTAVMTAGDDQVLYLQYNEVVRASGSSTITALVHAIDKALSAGDVTRLVVDLRYNQGGNDRTYAPLLDVLTSNPALAPPGALIALIGRQTFSAAVLLATELDAETNAVFVGEPTGGSPNLYADPRALTLPNTGIVVHVSSKYFEVGGPADPRDAIAPDIEVTASLEDFLAGRDPVLDAALEVGLDAG